MRTAAYARFSSDLQRDTSLEDQLRNCREYAERHAWTWQDDQIFSDAGISGASIEGRAGLQALLTAAASAPRPFDVLLVDDSSRVSRDLADALRIVQRLKFAGVRVIYISQGIDSDSEQHETLIAVHGLVDGLYLREMAAKTKRGLKGQLTRGFATGGKTYGYRSVGIPDPNRHGEMVGYRLEIEPAEAEAIRRIFRWYADGVSVPNVITKLTEQGHPAPRGGSWRVGAVQRILRNPKYVGRLVWGRTQQMRRPGSRSKSRKVLPPEQWQTLQQPELRIVSDELAARVAARMRTIDAALNHQRRARTGLINGRNARLHSSALFSGFMTCAACGHAVNVVGNHIVKGVRYRYYGCAHASRNGDTVCTNRLKVRVEVADRALLAGLQAELLRPETVAYISDQLAHALNAIIDQRPAQRADLQRAREAARTKLHHLIAAVENGAGAPTIYEAIAAREAEIRALDAQQAALDEPLAERLAVMPSWVRHQLENAAGLVADVPERAKVEFERLGVGFVLHPVTDEGDVPFLRAVGSGDFEHLAFSRFLPLPTTDRSRARAAGSRKFIVDLRSTDSPRPGRRVG